MDNFTLHTILVIAYWVIPVVLYAIVRIIVSVVRLVSTFARFIKRLRSHDASPIIRSLPWKERVLRFKLHFTDKTLRTKLLIKVLSFSIYLLVGIYPTYAYSEHYFHAKPEVTYTNANTDEIYVNEQNAIVVYFDRPINDKSLVVKTAPENFGIEVTYFSPFESAFTEINKFFGTHLVATTKTGVRISPTQSIPYDTGLIYYIAGIQSNSGDGGIHEYAMNVNSPKFPTKVVSSVIDKQVDVPITESIYLEFDQPVIKSLEYLIEFTPAVEFTVATVDLHQIRIDLAAPLEQGRDYHMSVSIARRDVNLKTNATIALDDLEELLKVAFKTVTPPGIKSITPSGAAVIPSAKVEITFTEPIVAESVEKHLTIEPAVPYTLTWVKENLQLSLTFSQPLEKAKKYTIVFGKEVASIKGGILNKEIKHSFETVGYVKVTKHSPANNAGNASTYTAISITFDQEVDHASAQSKISVLPATSVKYSWSGNTLTIRPKSSLKYSTRYSVTINSGIKSKYGYDSDKKYSFSFVTRSQVITLKVPAYKQGWGTFDCNIVALQMALAAKGVSASTSAIKSYIGYGAGYNESSHTGGNPNADWIDHYGVHWDPIAAYARSRGRAADVKRGWSMAGIASEISKGNPVVIFWYNGVSGQTRYSWHYTYGARPGLHSVVVYGFRGEESKPTGFYVHDPWPSFYQEYYTAGAFAGKWAYFGYSAVVVK